MNRSRRSALRSQTTRNKSRRKVWEPDDDERWEVMVLSYFWTNSRPKFKDIIIEKEVECKNTICRCSSTIAKL